MPVIKMSRTERGSRDGLRVETFIEGVEYDIPDSLVVAFRTMGALEEDLHKPTETPEAIAPAMERPDPVVRQTAAESRDQMTVPPRAGRSRKPKA